MSDISKEPVSVTLNVECNWGVMKRHFSTRNLCNEISSTTFSRHISWYLHAVWWFYSQQGLFVSRPITTFFVQRQIVKQNNVHSSNAQSCSFCRDSPHRNTNDFIITFLFLYLHIFTEERQRLGIGLSIPSNSSDRPSDLFSISATSDCGPDHTRSPQCQPRSPSVTVRRAGPDKSLTAFQKISWLVWTSQLPNFPRPE